MLPAQCTTGMPASLRQSLPPSSCSAACDTVQGSARCMLNRVLPAGLRLLVSLESHLSCSAGRLAASQHASLQTQAASGWSAGLRLLTYPRRGSFVLRRLLRAGVSAVPVRRQRLAAGHQAGRLLLPGVPVVLVLCVPLRLSVPQFEVPPKRSWYRHRRRMPYPARHVPLRRRSLRSCSGASATQQWVLEFAARVATFGVPQATLKIAVNCPLCMNTYNENTSTLKHMQCRHVRCDHVLRDAAGCTQSSSQSPSLYE